MTVISMTLLKQLCEDICVPIAKLVNMSLEQGVVPDAMKLAKVMPIHKAKSKQLFTNYRPISLLSNMSKVLEKVIHNRMMEFLVKHDILYNKQFFYNVIYRGSTFHKRMSISQYQLFHLHHG